MLSQLHTWENNSKGANLYFLGKKQVGYVLSLLMMLLLRLVRDCYYCYVSVMHKTLKTIHVAASCPLCLDFVISESPFYLMSENKCNATKTIVNNKTKNIFNGKEKEISNTRRVRPIQLLTPLMYFNLDTQTIIAEIFMLSVCIVVCVVHQVQVQQR